MWTIVQWKETKKKEENELDNHNREKELPVQLTKWIELYEDLKKLTLNKKVICENFGITKIWPFKCELSQ